MLVRNETTLLTSPSFLSRTQLTAVGGRVAPPRHQAVEGGGVAQLNQHVVLVQVVAVVLRVPDQLGGIDPLLGAFIHSDVGWPSRTWARLMEA